MPRWRSKLPEEYQKWDYITLSDFTSSSCGTAFSYCWLWFLAFIGVTVYGLDTYTAVNLLAFDKWDATFKPTIPLYVAKWIFAGCILFSWLLLAYEWFKAIRVMKRQNVAESYLDPLAVTAQSMRMGQNGQGWRRFLVFKELTKSKKGADYTALFCFFQFKGAVRVCLAEGPRQAINALTLYSIMRASLIPVGAHAPNDGNAPFVQFWVNVKILYETSPQQAIVLFTMLFTFVIWLFSALSLLAAAIFYVGFLWHYLPKDGGLFKYCRRKVDKRLATLVNTKAKHALEKEEFRRRRDEEKYGLDPNRPMPPARTATLPSLGEATMPSPSLHHSSSTTSTNTCISTLAKETSYTAADPRPTLPNIGDLEKEPSSTVKPLPSQTMLRPGMPSRTGTQSSNVTVSSFASDRPLLPRSASYDQGMPPAQTQPFDNRNGPPPQSSRTPMPAPIRSMTGSSIGTQRPLQHGPVYNHPPPQRLQTAQSFNNPYSRPPPADGQSYEMQSPPIPRRPVPGQYRPPQPYPQQQPMRQQPLPPPQQQWYPPQPPHPTQLRSNAPPQFHQPPPPPTQAPLQQDTPLQRNNSYTPFRPSPPPDDPYSQTQQQQRSYPPPPIRSMSLAGQGQGGQQAPVSRMERATPPPRVGTAPPRQGQGQGLGYRQ